MERRVLGGTGISVSGFALGTMMLGAMGNTDHDESIRMIHTALDAGINFVDTADVYSRGESEEIVGKALAGGRRRRAWCWPPSSGSRWRTILTGRVLHPDGSLGRSKPASGVLAPTTSISTNYIDPTTGLISTRH